MWLKVDPKHMSLHHHGVCVCKRTLNSGGEFYTFTTEFKL